MLHEEAPMWLSPDEVNNVIHFGPDRYAGFRVSVERLR
jgi:hypothetical protein